jgi:hypothetical protein
MDRGRNAKHKPAAVGAGLLGLGEDDPLRVTEANPLLHDDLQLFEDAELGRTVAARPDQGRSAPDIAAVFSTPLHHSQIVAGDRLLFTLHLPPPSGPPGHGYVLRDFFFLVAPRVVSRAPGKCDPDAFGMQEISVRAFAASVHEASANQARHQLAYLSRHRGIVSR